MTDKLLNWQRQQRQGWKTLKQLYKLLKKQNKVCKKQDVKVKFIIELPI